MVENGPFRWRNLAECRQYVTDRKGGVTADIVAAIGKDLEVDDKKVQEIWGQRLSDVFEVDGGGVKTPVLVTAYQDAHWGAGSWLRAGAGGGAGAGPVAPGAGGVRNPRTPRGGGAVGAGAGGAAGAQGQAQWDDPETWWGKQALRTKELILKAMCAEAIMKVEKIYEEPCSNCGGSGSIEVMNAGGGTGSSRFTYPCSVCRGSGKFVGVSYR
jgi:hypothetical protein